MGGGTGLVRRLGDSRNNRLFITATTSVFAVFLNVRGGGYPFRY
jgi:gluconolactonase